MTDRLVATGVGVHYDGASRPALTDASIAVRSGELHALVGPNGAGKSTLFGVLAGDITPTAGDVVLDGRRISGIPPRDLARARAVLLQESRVSFPFTVTEIVAVVLHDLNAALAYADRVTLLSGGRVVAAGTPSDVLTAGAIEDVYGQAVDVFPHPTTGVPLIVPRRG